MMFPGEMNRRDECVLIAEMATGLWRLRHRLLPGEEQPGPVLLRVRRDVESLWDRLLEAGVEVLEHTDQPYRPGDALKVLAFQAVPGIDQERVIETLRPTVYYRSQWIQMG